MMDSTHCAASTFRQLPIFAIGLSEDARNDTTRAVATLSKWRHDRLIKPPQTAITQRQSALISRNLAPYAGDLSSFGAWVGIQRKPPGCTLSAGRCFAATRSASVAHTEVSTMIYTFLIPHSRTCRLADLHRIRTITVVVVTAKQAHELKTGLTEQAFKGKSQLEAIEHVFRQIVTRQHFDDQAGKWRILPKQTRRLAEIEDSNITHTDELARERERRGTQ